MSSSFVSNPFGTHWLSRCASCDIAFATRCRKPAHFRLHNRAKLYAMIYGQSPTGNYSENNHGGEGSGDGKEESTRTGRSRPWSKFDPDSPTDAFGRDPRKETEFWMDGAREVLASDIVVEALAEYEADGGDGLTDQQRAYLEFANSINVDGKASKSSAAEKDSDGKANDASLENE